VIATPTGKPPQAVTGGVDACRQGRNRWALAVLGPPGPVALRTGQLGRGPTQGRGQVLGAPFDIGPTLPASVSQLRWSRRHDEHPVALGEGSSGVLGQGAPGPAVLSAEFVCLGAASAYASPSNAKTSLTGTFDCGAVGTGTFVVNSGNAQAATTWNVAHLTFADGSTAIFQPRALDLTFTFQGQSMTEIASKNGPGSTVCDISAAQDGFSLTGTVTGKVTYN
jgi:hypothetical protein